MADGAAPPSRLAELRSRFERDEAVLRVLRARMVNDVSESQGPEHLDTLAKVMKLETALENLASLIRTVELTAG